MTDKQINKWLRRRFSPIGWVLLFLYGLMTALTSLTAFADVAKQTLWSFATGDFSGTVNWDVINANAWGYIASIFVGFVLLDAWKGSSYWYQALRKREKPMKGKTFLCILVLCMGAQMANSLWISLLELLLMPFGKSVMPILESVAGSSDTFSMFLYASILAPVWEELLFRGYVLGTLRPFGKRFSIWGSALLFGLFHGNLLQAPYAVLVGLLLGYITVEYSLIWSILLHMFNNLVLADLLSRITASWPETAYGILNLILFGGSALFSVMLLLRKRLEIREYRTGEWMDRRCVKCFLTSTGILVLAVLMCANMALLLRV